MLLLLLSRDTLISTLPVLRDVSLRTEAEARTTVRVLETTKGVNDSRRLSSRLALPHALNLVATRDPQAFHGRAREQVGANIMLGNGSPAVKEPGATFYHHAEPMVQERWRGPMKGSGHRRGRQKNAA